MTVNYAAPLEPDEIDDVEVDEPVVKPKPRHRRKGMLFAGIGLIVVAVIAIVAGLSYVAPEFVSEAQFQDVRNHAYDVDDSGQEEGDPSGLDWDYLNGLNGDIKAWLTVENTNIDYPVMQSSDNDFYLWRGMDGVSNDVGTPFIDYRCADGADSENVVVYGHHMGISHTVFDAISHSYTQDVFDGLGRVWWKTPGKLTEFKVAYAMRVEERYGKVQTFEFKDDKPVLVQGMTWTDAQQNAWESDPRPVFKAWLDDMHSDATAEAAGYTSLGVPRALCLVTCSEPWANAPWRCVLVCVPA